MTLAIFDLDNTLIGGDSDYLWGRFLVENHLVDGEEYERENQRYYDEYKAGTLDIYEFLRFSLKPLSTYRRAQLEQWREKFLHHKIEPILLPKAFELLDKHRAQGHTLVIITATNRFVTEPIAQRLGVSHLMATDPEMRDGEYTGNVYGVPCFREGKVQRLQAWLELHKRDLNGSWFYSDSHNDLPLLNTVENPVAVDADPMLAKVASQRGWPHISLR